MEKKMFGKRLKKYSERSMDSFDEAAMRGGKTKDAPPGYEGKEHVKYKNPGFTRHEIRFPQDEPHMKSHSTKEEAHEMEDNFHMGVPDQTATTLEAKLKRARMKADAPDHDDPDPIQGIPVHNVSARGEADTSGEEEMGPNDMQGSGKNKEYRKKMIVAVIKNKMKKKR